MKRLLLVIMIAAMMLTLIACGEGEVETTGADVTTASPTVEATDAPATDAPATDATSSENNGGCGSSVSIAGIVAVATLATGIAFVAKKKED